MKNRSNAAKQKKQTHRRYRKTLVAVAGSLLILVFLITAVVFFIPRDNTSFSYECWKLRFRVASFFGDVIDGDFSDAAEDVYFVSAEDGGVLAADDAVRTAWVSRMEALRTGIQNNFLADYSDLTVRKENGKMIVTVLLSVERQGYPDKFYRGHHTLSVVETEDGWKIAGITEEPIKTDFEKAISGVISASELGGDAL